MNKYGRYAFYGSLRQGMENHLIYNKAMKFIRTVMLEGYSLYSLGDYPYAVRSEGAHSAKRILADLIYFQDRAVEHEVHRMELEAGYIYEEIEIDSLNYGIYLFKEPVTGDLEIESGDWVNYFTQKK